MPNSSPSRSKSAKKQEQGLRTYVLDTSVLLSDPKAMFRFKEQSVVIPIVVINELEKKRHDPEIGFFARQALRALDDLRQEHERLDFPIEVGEGGTLRVELNHIDQSVLPVGYQLGDNDSRILAVAMNLANEGNNITVVSQDLPMRVKVASLGLHAEEYRNNLAVDSGWTGQAEITITSEQMNDLYENEVVTLEELKGMPANTGLVISSDRGQCLGRLTRNGQVHLVRGDRDVFGVHGRSSEQKLAIDC